MVCVLGTILSASMAMICISPLIGSLNEPESIPGRLKLAGLLYSGTLEGQQVAFIPIDLRALLLNLLK